MYGSVSISSLNGQRASLTVDILLCISSLTLCWSMHGMFIKYVISSVAKILHNFLFVALFSSCSLTLYHLANSETSKFYFIIANFRPLFACIH